MQPLTAEQLGRAIRERRLRLVYIHPKNLASLLGSARLVAQALFTSIEQRVQIDLPFVRIADKSTMNAAVVNAGWDVTRNAVAVVLCHPDFDRVPLGSELPDIGFDVVMASFALRSDNTWQGPTIERLREI